MKNICRFFLCAFTVAAISACSFIKELPIAVAYRNSLIDNGLVIIITNASKSDTLTHLGVRVVMPNGEKRETMLDVSLTPGETVEAGWLELMKPDDDDPKRSAIVPGTMVEIFAHGYARTHTFTLPSNP